MSDKEIKEAETKIVTCAIDICPHCDADVEVSTCDSDIFECACSNAFFWNTAD